MGRGTGVLPEAVPLRAVDAVARDGLLVAGLKVDGLPVIWSNIPLPPGSNLALLDSRSGRILAGTGRLAIRVNELVHPENLERVRAGALAWRSTGAGGQEYLRAVEWVSVAPWTA